MSYHPHKSHTEAAHHNARASRERWARMTREERRAFRHTYRIVAKGGRGADARMVVELAILHVDIHDRELVRLAYQASRELSTLDRHDELLSEGAVQ